LIRKYLLLILFILPLGLVATTGSVMDTGFARLQYDGGGDWYNDPEVLPNLARYVNAVLGTHFPIDQAIVKAGDAKLFMHPFVYISGHGNIRFTDREVENLREWMLRGGFLYADDDYGMDTSFRREIKRVFPEHELQKLDSSFPIYSSFYDFAGGLPKIHEHDGKAPEAFGVFDDNGRLMCLYTWETNISDGWADPSTHNDPPEVRDTALRFGLNIVYYVMNR